MNFHFNLVYLIQKSYLIWIQNASSILNRREEYEHENRAHMDMTAKKFMERQDFVEFNDNEEILVKDDFGVYIMYDWVDTDLEMLRNELLLAGSYFIKRQEPMMNSEDIENMNPLIDRISTLEMLMKYESKFQYK